MSFSWASSYLLGDHKRDAVAPRSPYRLERMVTLLEQLGNPQDSYPTLHVGGTSGKGSTSAMLAAVLTATGKRCGLHMKPHLISMTERALVDNVAISELVFADILGDMISAIDRTTALLNRPSFYEITLALAFIFFQRAEVDVAVIEVGIGGRLDGTNVLRAARQRHHKCRPRSSRDAGRHRRADRARQKPASPSPVSLWSLMPSSRRSPSLPMSHPNRSLRFFSVRALAKIEDAYSTAQGQRFTVVTDAARYAISTSLLGTFQLRNAATAIVALERLGDDLRPSVDEVEAGFARVVIPGRMGICARAPRHYSRHRAQPR